MKHRFFLILFVFLIILILISDKFLGVDLSRSLETSSETALTGIIYSHVKADDSEYIFKSNGIKILVRGENLDDNLKKILSDGAKAEIILVPELPEESSNFGSFDYRKYLSGKKIKYISSFSAEDVTVIKKKPLRLCVFGALVRNALSNASEKYLGSEAAAFTEAIITGDTGRMNESESDMIRIAGLSHLTAVSGMHVMYFILPVKKILRNKKTGIRMRNFLLIPFLLFFAAVADMSCSVLRAVISNIIVCACSFLEKPPDKFNHLGLTGTVQLFINPYCIYNSGFVLSYLSIIAIYLAVPFLKNVKSDFTGPDFVEKNTFVLKEYILNGIITSCAVNTVLFPALVYYYGEISILGILLNIPASPLTCIIFICGFILLTVSLINFNGAAYLLSYIQEKICLLFSIILKTGKKISETFGIFRIPYPGIFFTSCYYMILATLFSARKNYRRAVVYICFLIIFTVKLDTAYKSGCVITVWDVGQSSCALVQADGKNILIDTGDGKTDIVSLLEKAGVFKIDILILSHGHSDHAGGMDLISEGFKIGTYIYPDNIYDEKAAVYAEVLKNKGTECVKISGNCSLEAAEGLTIDFYFKCGNELNNASVMACVTFCGVRTVFPADIMSESEQYFAESGLLKDSDILIAAHHGSKNSSGSEFLSKISPEYVIISVGENNVYGHPSAEALERLSLTGAEIYRTDQNGAVRIKIDTEGQYEIWAKKE